MNRPDSNAPSDKREAPCPPTTRARGSLARQDMESAAGFVSINAAAQWLGISRFTLYYWAAARKIPHYRIGRRVMFSKVDLEAWLRSHRLEMA